MAREVIDLHSYAKKRSSFLNLWTLFCFSIVIQVARYNTLQQNAQTLNVNLANTVLAKAKPEILRVIELLIDKMQADIVDLLVEVEKYNINKI